MDLPCQHAELKAEKYGEKPPLKGLKNWGAKICDGENYASKHGS
jgi:hypothetical protein